MSAKALFFLSVVWLGMAAYVLLVSTDLASTRFLLLGSLIHYCAALILRALKAQEGEG